MTKFQKRYFNETLEHNETNSGHKHDANMYSSRFQKNLYDESALSRFEVLTKRLYICNEDRPYYATQYQNIFVQYHENYNFITSKASADFKDEHITIPNGAPSITLYTKTDMRNGYVIPQKSPVYRKSEKNELIRKKLVWCCTPKCTN